MSAKINALSGQDINLCYQCQKCTATCPVSEYMDIKPYVMVRKVMRGDNEEIMKSRTIWLCTGCETCGSRCPNMISIGSINEFFREHSVKNNVTPAVKPALAIHKAFLGSIERFGIVHEASMLLEFKIRARDLFSDIGLGLKMFLKGKIPFLPHKLKGLDELKRIMRKRQ